MTFTQVERISTLPGSAAGASSLPRLSGRMPETPVCKLPMGRMHLCVAFSGGVVFSLDESTMG